MCMSTGFEQSCYAILSQVSAQEQVLVTHMQQVPFLLLIQPMGATIQACFFFLLSPLVWTGLLTNVARPSEVFLFVLLQARSSSSSSSSISQSFIWLWQASLFRHFG